jgi:hypothetical protein
MDLTFETISQSRSFLVRKIYVWNLSQQGKIFDKTCNISFHKKGPKQGKTICYFISMKSGWQSPLGDMQ